MRGSSSLIDENSTIKINSFCRKVCLKINEPKETKSEIYEELKSNIKEQVIQLVKSNITSDEATRIVLKRYHSPQHMVNELGSIYKTKKIINSKQLYSAILFFICSFVLIITFYFWNFTFLELQARQFYDLLPDTEEYTENGVSPTTKEMIKFGVDNSLSVRSVLISIVDGNNEFSGENHYFYSSEESKISSERESNVFYNSFFFGLTKKLLNSDTIVEAEIEQIQLSYNSLYFAIFLFVCYWILFSFWAISNLNYKYQKNKIAAIILVLLFNIIGYIFFTNVKKINFVEYEYQ